MSQYFKLIQNENPIWKISEVNALMARVKADTTLSALSRLHRRSQDSIKAKLNSIAADYYFTDHKVFKQIQLITGVIESEFLVKRVSSQPKLAITVPDEENVQMNTSPIVPPPTQEEITTNLCTNIAFTILDTVIGSSLILRSTITHLQSIRTESDV
jgi:hypothetical protein